MSVDDDNWTPGEQSGSIQGGSGPGPASYEEYMNEREEAKKSHKPDCLTVLVVIAFIVFVIVGLVIHFSAH